MIGTIVLLAAVLFAADHGVIGQSQPQDAEPLAFLTAAVVGDADGNVYLNGEWRVRAGTFEPERIVKRLGHPLKSDGRDIYSYHRNDGGLWLVKASADGLSEVRKAVVFPTLEWGLRFAIAPVGCSKGFAARTKFAVLDRKERKVVGFSADGADLGTLVDYSGMAKADQVGSVGFFSETGDILLGTGYPERRTHRFAADGREIVDGSWPCAAEAAEYLFANGRTWAVSCRVTEVTCDFSAIRALGEGEIHNYTSVAWAGKGYWIGTTRGAEYYDAVDPTVPVRRLGGTGNVTTLAILDGRVFATVGSRICMYYLDDLPDEAMDSDDFQLWHLGGYREGIVTGVCKRDGKLVYGFRPASGPDETWQFDYRIRDWTHRADRLHRIDEHPPVTDGSAAVEGRWSVAFSPERQAIVRQLRKEAVK